MPKKKAASTQARSEQPAGVVDEQASLSTTEHYERAQAVLQALVEEHRQTQTLLAPATAAQQAT